MWHTKQTLNTMIDELQEHIDKIINEQNNRGISEFEGYSPFEMQFILYDTFEERSPIQLTKLTDFTNFPKKIHINDLNYFPIDNNNFVFTKF